MFEIGEETTIIFQPASRLLTIFGPNSTIYHLQASNNKQVAVKFPRAGMYNTSAQIVKVIKGIERPKKISLPAKDRNFDNSKFHVKYNSNLTHTPARLFYEVGLCEIGPEFKKLPSQWQNFLFEHEKAHFHYSGEENADLCGLNSFLQAGFNASQAFYALDEVLRRNPENIERTRKILNYLKN